jgi:hypothetical protein
VNAPSRFRGNDVTFDGPERSGAKNLHLVAALPRGALCGGLFLAHSRRAMMSVAQT